jgi:hypothetical protein
MSECCAEPSAQLPQELFDNAVSRLDIVSIKAMREASTNLTDMADNFYYRQANFAFSLAMPDYPRFQQFMTTWSAARPRRVIFANHDMKSNPIPPFL